MDAIESQISEINSLIAGIAKGDVGEMAKTLSGFNASLYKWASEISESIISPIALSVLALLCMMELYRQAVRIQGAGEAFSAELVFRMLFKAFVCKEALDRAPKFLEGVFNLSSSVISSIALKGIKPGELKAAIDVSSLESAVKKMSLFSQLMALITCWLVKLVVWAAAILVNVIVIGRFVEALFMLCLSPIPMATLPNDEMSHIGKNFLKSFAALSAQGALAYLAYSFFPVVALPMLEGVGAVSDFAGLMAALGKVLVCSCVLIVMVSSSRKFANSIFSAA